MPALLPGLSIVLGITSSSFLLCDRQLLTWPPGIPASWYSHSCIISSCQVWAGPSDLLPKNRVQQKLWHHFTLMNRLGKTVASILLTYSYCLHCLYTWIKQGAFLERATWQGTQAISQWETEAHNNLWRAETH